jgi:hypothetical protein
MCVCGVANMGYDGQGFFGLLYALVRAFLAWLCGFFRTERATGSRYVRVRVLLDSAPKPSSDPQAGDGTTYPDDGGNFTVTGVSVPVGGTSFNAWAWLLDTDGTVHTIYDQGNVPFTSGGDNPRDCCAGCPPGSGSGLLTAGLARALAGKAHLDVTVPDGKNAGIHKAKSIALLKWQVTLGSAHFAIGTCAAGKTLVIQGPGVSVSSRAIALKPFSAAFPGASFGATKDVVVT